MSRVYATPEIKREPAYRRAERLEREIAPRKWATPGLTPDDLEVLADAWEEAGFLGEADNYRAAARRLCSRDPATYRRAKRLSRAIHATRARTLRDPKKPKSRTRLRAAKPKSTRKAPLAQRSYVFEGVTHYPYRIRYTTEDGRERTTILHAPGDAWIGDTIRRWIHYEDVPIKRGSDVVISRVPTRERDTSKRHPSNFKNRRR